MQNRLPNIIAPLHLADKRGELHGEIPVKQLTRLTELLVDQSGVVSVALYFGREGRLAKIEGQLKATLQLACQNCLQTMTFEIDHTVNLGIVTTIEQVERLPEELEPLFLEDESMLISELIEEELLLSIPDYPKHLPSCVENEIIKHYTVAFDDTPPPKKANPFSVLVDLKLLEKPHGSTKK